MLAAVATDNLSQFLEKNDIPIGAVQPRPRKGEARARSVQFYLQENEYAFRCFSMWANHLGFGTTHGLARTGLVLVMYALRTLGPPPGMTKREWKPDLLAVPDDA